MRPLINLRFRPSLIIFVDKTGERICEHFRSIVRITCFDETLHQGIALLQVTPGSRSAEPVPIGATFPDFDDDIPTTPDVLEQLVKRAMNSVKLAKRLRDIGDAGYPVPNPRPQVYIVGDANSTELASILQIVREQLAASGFNTLVCYVLSAYQREQQMAGGDMHQLLDYSLSPLVGTAYWAQREVANFCYLYEDQFSYPTPRSVTEEESHYAAAEALFALISTGITPDPVFDQYMQLSPNLTTYSNVGSLGTSLIIFPHDALLEFCSTRLGITLMRQWLAGLNREVLSEKERQRLQQLAEKAVHTIEQWIIDQDERPFANGIKKSTKDEKEEQASKKRNLWPRLAILNEDNHPTSPQLLVRQKTLLRDLRTRTGTLFRWFWSEDVAEEFKKQRRRRDAWTRLVYQRGGKAVEAYYEWDKVASMTWEAAEQRCSAAVKHSIDELWGSRQHGIDGFEMARTYTAEFDERLAKLQDQLIRLREAHERDYQDSLDAFELLSDGPWVTPSAISNAGNTAQIKPTMAGDVQLPDANAGNAPALLHASGVGTQPGAVTHRHLPPREEQVAEQLEQRILWLQDQVPSIPTQVTIGLPFLLAVVLLGLALYPQLSLLFTLSLIVVTALAIGLGNWAFWRRYQRKVEEAREDLLKFYRRYYAYRSEQREDALRRIVMVPLRMKILRIRERLDDISTFIGEVQHRLDEQSQRIRREIFNSPSGTRDIYVANGARLQKKRKNTVEEFEGQVTRQREKDPVEKWHETAEDMTEMLIESFRHLPESILEMDDASAQRHIYEFTCDIVKCYFKGALVNIERALDNVKVWQDALDCAQSPLYRAEVGIREPQLLFVCGQETDLLRSAPHFPENTTPVLISEHHDWILITALFRGGSPSAFNPDILFPDRQLPASPSAIEDDDDDDNQDINNDEDEDQTKTRTILGQTGA